MATNKPKISGYIPQHIFDLLLRFKDEQGFKSVSEALTVILSIHFGVETEVDHKGGLLPAKYVPIEEFQALQERVNSLFVMVESLTGSKDAISQSEPQSEPLNKVINEPPLPFDSDVVKVKQEAGIMGKDLARRLGIGKSTLSTKKKTLSASGLLEYTSGKDPDGIGWRYSDSDRLYYSKGSSLGSPNSELLA